MTDQYVFEVQFKHKTDKNSQTKTRENNIFVIIDGESMTEFSKLQTDLKKIVPPVPFKVQYIDEDEDIISIDTEDEFQEFVKLAKKRSSRGLLIRVVLDSNISTDIPTPSTSHQVVQTPTKTCDTNYQNQETRVVQERNNTKNIEVIETFSLKDIEDAMALDNTIHDTKYDGAQNGTDFLSDISLNETQLMKLKEKIKNEVKEEILSAMNDKMKGNAVFDLAVKENPRYEAPRCEEDSDSNMFCGEDRALKYFPYLPYQKKLEKKEKHFDTKIDQRLEKLELKKKKLLEKASFRTVVNRKTSSVVSKVGVPCIMSALQTTESSTLAKRVTMGKAFLHMWHILNDGTLTWTNVELRHTWSSPGLEPDELSVKCPPVAPGQEAQVAIKFKTPKIVGAFISYWHLFYQADTHWQQFGHYISVSGYSKLPKQDVAKKSKQETILTAKGGVRSNICFKENDKEICIASLTSNVGEDSTMCDLQKQVTKSLEASLASAQIAAEMAREAAKAALRQACAFNENSGKPVTGDSNTTNGLDKLNDSVVEVFEGIQALNVVDSSSDTEANNDTNEETFPEFVMVEKMNCDLKDDISSQSEHVDQVEAGVTVTKEINEMTDARDNDNTTADLRVENKEIQDRKVIFARANGPVNCPVIYEQNTEPQRPFNYHKVDSNVNYSVFPSRVPGSLYAPAQQMPGPLFTPTQQIPHHHAPHGFPVFPPQNSSAHPLVFPPRVDFYMSSKMNTPVHHYPQIPTYSPIQTSHPIPLISAGLAQPTAQSTMLPPPQINPPQLNPVPITPLVCDFPITPLGMPAGYENPSGQATTAFGMKKDPKVVNMFASFPENLKQTTENSLSSVTTSATEASEQQDVSSVSKDVSAEQKNRIPEQRDSVAEQKEKDEPAVGKKRADEGIQILPQSLVDGAINVAATAYSTAWNAFSNLRQKEGDEVEFDPVFENNMALLVEMGFNNLERNALLLKRFNNDVSQVIGVICASGGGNHFNID